MPTGKIKKLIPERGFGFIKADGGKDVYFHASAFDGEFDQLSEGQTVEYTLDQAGGGKGPRAASVKPA